MRKLIKYIPFICLLLTTSCMDEDPIDKVAEKDFYKSTEDINQAVIACYNGLQDPIKQEWKLTELRSDNSRHYIANSTNQLSLEIYAVNKFTVATTHSVNESYWQKVYHNIANCNTVLKYIDVVNVEGLKKQYEGEALFLRSYHYFNLVRLYGPLFLVTKRIDMQEANAAKRSSVEEVYAQIESDLKTCIGDASNAGYLPLTYSSTEKGRVDRWAAKALLAKVYLTQGRLEEARTLLLDVKTNSGYALLTGNTAYKDVFSISNEMNKEILFAIRFKSGGYGLGSPFANAFAPANSFNVIINAGGAGDNAPTSNLIKSYDPLDKRKDATLTETWVNPSNQTVYTSFVNKYWSQVTVKDDAENDWPVIRFADVVLMLAEIENELSGPAVALPYINETRTRAGLTALTVTDVANKYLFRMAVEKERRFEFAFENHRFFDLVRTNRLITVMKAHFDTEMVANASSGKLASYYGGKATDGSFLPVGQRDLKNTQLLLPIPYSVISVAKNATQNPGY